MRGTRPENELINLNINHEKAHPEEVAEFFIQHLQSGFFTTVFGFFTTAAGKIDLMEKKLLLHLPLQVFAFPVAAVLEIAEAVAALKLLYSSKNKNLGKTLDSLKKLQKAAVITIAIALGMAAVITGTISLAATVPYLFVAAIGLNTLYSMGQFVKNTYKYLTTPKGSALRETYKKRMIETGIRSLVGTALSVVIGLLFIAAIASPVGLAVTSGVGIAFIVGAVVTGVVLGKRAKKRAAKAKLREREQAQPQAETQEIRNALGPNATNAHILKATVATASGHQSDYYYTRNLPRLLDAAREVSLDKLKTTFLGIINEKLERLDLQIKAKDPHSWFKDYQSIKRQHKVDALTALKALIQNNGQEAKPITEDSLNSIIKEHPKVFQSFFKNKGDVEVIFDAAREYFVEQVEEEQESESPSPV